VIAEGRCCAGAAASASSTATCKDEGGRLIVHATCTVKIVRAEEGLTRAIQCSAIWRRVANQTGALLLHMTDDAVDSGDAAGAADHAQMQADRHHLRLPLAFGP
jgi:hypothetical protein